MRCSWWSYCIGPGLLLLGSLLLCLYLLSFLSSSYVAGPTPGVIVSLTSTARRVTKMLPIAVKSLLAQTVLPAEIRVYLPIEDRGTIERALRDSIFLREWLRHPLVKLYFVKDLGPGTKFIYVINEFLVRLRREYSEELAKQLLIIVDDDQWYSPTLVESFIVRNRLYPDVAIGDRGWRIRPDLVWGVTLQELQWHVILSFDIAEPYRVGVITANKAYLIQPRFFLNNGAHNIVNTSYGPPGAFWMDDIWLNGWLAAAGVPRYVIPTDGITFSINEAAPSLIDSRKRQAHNKRSRRKDNNEVLDWFRYWWEPNLWYEFGGVNGPKYKPRTQLNWLRFAYLPSWLHMRFAMYLLEQFPPSTKKNRWDSE